MEKPDGVSNHVQLITDLAKIPGDIAEFGCYNGGQTCRIAENFPDRIIWAFDTFQGIPVQDYDATLDWDNPPGKFEPTHDVVAYLQTYPNIKVCKGRFVDTLLLIPPGTVFSVVLVDCDYYASHLQVLTYLEEHGHLQPGSALTFDDYNHLDGARKAVDEWRKDRPLTHEGKVIIY